MLCLDLAIELSEQGVIGTIQGEEAGHVKTTVTSFGIYIYISARLASRKTHCRLRSKELSFTSLERSDNV